MSAGVVIPCTWACLQCGAAGPLVPTDDMLFKRVMQDAENAHAERSPWCQYNRHWIRIAVSLQPIGA